VKPKGRDLALSPEATPDELFDLALEYPDEVLANPALRLIALEDPGSYRALTRHARLGRTARLAEAEWRLFGLRAYLASRKRG
jgi:hypothetical protein